MGYAVLCLDKKDVKVVATFTHRSNADRLARQHEKDAYALGYDLMFYVKVVED